MKVKEYEMQVLRKRAKKEMEECQLCGKTEKERKCKNNDETCTFYNNENCTNMTAYNHCDKNGIEYPEETTLFNNRSR